jgi:outer membrane lipoprotein carrier protein
MFGNLLSFFLSFSIPLQPLAALVDAPAPAEPPPAAFTVQPERRVGAAPALQLDAGFSLAAADAVATKVATGVTAEQLVDAVQAFYADLAHVKAKFRQEVTNATFGKTSKNDGMLWIAKPGKMRWDYQASKKKGGRKVVQTTKSFISNGAYLYVVDHGNKQILEKDLQKDLMPVAVSFLYGKGDLKKDFNAVLDASGKRGGKQDLVLELTPKTPSAQYKALYLVVARDNHRVKESIIVDSAGNVNHFRFYEPDFKTPVKDKWFEFDKKSLPKYRVVSGDAASADDK